MRIKAILPFIIVIILYAGFRLIYLDHMAHGDERHWVGRSLNFYRALMAGEFEYTYQKEHPGVMTMWAGTLGYIFKFPAIFFNMEANNSTAETNILEMWGWGLQPPDVLVALRVSKVILQTIFFVISLQFLIPLVGKSTTLLFGALLAMSTTVFGWDSWLHIDGLAAISAFAGIIATAYAAERTEFYAKPTNRLRWLWFFAGAVCATSWLNRAIFLVLPVVVGLALLIQLFRQRTSLKANSTSFRSAAVGAISYSGIWALGAAVTTFILFPALWVNPVETVKVIIGVPLASARGEDHDIYVFHSLDDPGWSFYPTEILIRTTPFEWMGLLGTVVLAYFVWKRNLVPRAAFRLLPVLVIFAITFVVGLSISSKKAPQYVMIVYPIITLIASVGIVSMIRSLTLVWARFGKVLACIVLVSAISYSAVASFESLPYKNTYNNPLGLQLTDSTYSYTIRPGYPELADFFIALDPEPPTNVGYSSGAFGTIFPYLVPPSLVLEATSWLSMSSPAEWYEQDYQIIGVNYPSGETNHRYGVPPLYKLEVQDRVFWEVYPTEVVPPYRTVLMPSGCTTTFGRHVTLYQVAASYGETDFYFYSENGQPVTVEVFWEEGSVRRLLGRTGVDPIREDTMVKVSLEQLELNRSAGQTSAPLLIYVYDAESDNVLASTSIHDSDVSDHARVDSDCFSQPVPGT